MPLLLPRLALAVVAGGAVLLAGCADRSAALPVPSPSPAVPSPVRTSAATPVASPTPAPPAPVDGDVLLSVVHLGPSGQRLHPAGSTADRPVEMDRPVVRAFVGEIDRWLDARLTALQAGGVPNLPGHLDPATAPEAAEAVTTDLTTPDAPVAAATYATEVAVDGDPRWAHVTVTVDRTDGTTATADFVFVPGPRGPVLIAAGPSGEVRP
ncbi:MAG: hypothetical protein KY461_01170 [Actinobacteria bacterium]|nr:hypothetical protein [Actinomycetota bacterium]